MMFGRGHGKLAVSLVCSDWRLHHKRIDLNKRLSRLLKVDGVDVVAVPGPDGLPLPERATEWKVAVQQVALLASVHKPVALTVVAHQRCAGHPVDNEQHATDVMATAKALKEATKFEGPVVAVVATYHNDANWGLAKIGTA